MNNSLLLQTPEFRIKDGYCPGSGDRGTSKLQRKASNSGSAGSERNSKSSDLAQFYNELDRLQSKISQLLVYHHLADKLTDLPVVGGMLTEWGVSSIREAEVLKCLIFLEDALPALAASVYHQGRESKYNFREDFLEYLDRAIGRWAEQSASVEFQKFSTHLNLALLNQIRVGIRALEAQYRAVTKAPDLNGKVLNRLSTFLWAGIQQERELLGIPSKYWSGTMPPSPKEI